MESEEQDKSEQASTFKLQRARRKGNVARGTDLGYLTTLSAFLGFVWVYGNDFGDALAEAMRDGLVSAAAVPPAQNEMHALFGHLFANVAMPLAFLCATLFVFVFLFELVQTGPVFTGQPLKPDFSRLNPAKGLKRVFSLRMLIETAKNVLKLIVYVIVVWLVMRWSIGNALLVGDAAGLASLMFSAGFRLLACFAGAAALFALVDQLIVRKEFGKKMRMSRRELKRETRDREGEPRLKQRRKQLHAEFTKASESLRNVRGADVVITNPTHYAVALRYDPASMAAPLVVSRGANAFALRIKKLAFIYGVVLVENKELARDLFRRCVIDSPVPESHYRQIADIYLALNKRKQSDR